MQNNKQPLPTSSFTGWRKKKKRRKKKSIGYIFPRYSQRSHWRRNNTCRKWGGMFGKHLVDQYARQERGRETDRQREGETPRAQGREKSWGNSLCFSRVLLHFSVTLGRNIHLSSFFHPSEWNAERLGEERRREGERREEERKGGEEGLWVMSPVSPRGLSWL